MMKVNLIKILFSTCLLFLTSMLFAQSVGINTPSPNGSAALDVVSTTKGMLIPRMNSGQRTGISSPAIGLLVFDTSTESFWYNQSTGWIELSGGAFTHDDGTVTNTGNHNTDDFVFGRENLPPSTAISDTLMFFDKSKGAFRAGTVINTTSWSPDSIGFGSMALGLNTKAIGNYSTAMGFLSKATGIRSTAMGTSTIASELWSTAMGKSSTAEGVATTAIGINTKAKSYAGFALGRYNLGLGDSLSWVSTDPLLEIGIGSSDSDRKNAMTILKNGFVGIGTDTPTALFQVKKGSDINNPHLELIEEDIGFARLTMKNEISPSFWTLAASPNIDSSLARFNIYYSDKGDVFSLQGDGDAIISDRLGVGTTNPLATLHSNALIGVDPLRVQINGLTKMRVNANGGTSLGSDNTNVPTNGLYVQGNTGLGVNNATQKLEVNGNVNITGGIRVNGVVGTNGQLLGANSSGNLIWMTDADTSPTNEIQTLSKSGSTVTLSNGGGSFTDAVNDADASITNEVITSTALNAAKVFTISEGGSNHTTDLSSLDNGWIKNNNDLNYMAGNVGIGTSSPTALLQIQKNSNIDNPQLELVEVGADFARLTMKNDQDPSFWTLASKPNVDSTLSRFNFYYSDKGDILSLQGDGDAIISERLAVGTTAPLATLHSNAAVGSDALRIQVNGSTKMIVLANGGTSLGAFNTNVPVDGLYVQGNTGLGVNNASEKLEVNGNVKVTGGAIMSRNSDSSAPHLELRETPAGDGARINFTNAAETLNRWTLFGLADDIHGNSTFNLYYNGIGNMITANGAGNIGIKGIPDTDFHIYQDASGGSSNGLKMQKSGQADYMRFYLASFGHLWLFSDKQGAHIGQFNSSSGAYTTNSDRRLKKNFEDLHFNWSTFNQLVPLTYTFKNDEQGKRCIGLIAQDVEEIYPELVNYSEEEDIYTMDYSGFGVIAIKAIQEQQKEIEILKNEVKILKTQNEMLMARMEKLENAIIKLQ